MAIVEVPVEESEQRVGGRRQLRLSNPATLEPLYTIECQNQADVDAVVARAREAQPGGQPIGAAQSWRRAWSGARGAGSQLEAAAAVAAAAAAAAARMRMAAAAKKVEANLLGQPGRPPPHCARNTGTSQCPCGATACGPARARNPPAMCPACLMCHPIVLAAGSP